jgi:dihydroorotase
MSANPARLLMLDGGSQGRSRLIQGDRADLAIIDPTVEWTVDPKKFKTCGKNSPFKDRKLYGKVLMTLHNGRVVFTV